MLIFLNDPQYPYHGKVDGTLTARYSVALTCDGGVVSLDRADVLRVLPALQRFAETGQDLDGD